MAAGEAFFWCERCQRTLPALEVNYIAAGNTTMTACMTCGDAVKKEESRVKEPLVKQLLKSMGRAFLPKTLGITVVVLLISGLVSFVAYLPFIAFLRVAFLVVLLISVGIRVGYLFATLRAASLDVDDVTKSEVPTILELASPALRLFFVAVISFLPAMLVGWFGAPAILTLLVGLVGVGYFPGAVIIAAHADSMSDVADPVAVIRLIARIPGPYAIACAMLAGLFAVSSGVWFGVEWLLEGSVLAVIIAPLLSFQPLVCAARLLGTLVWEQREDI